MIKNNLSRADVAKAAGVSRAAITQWFHKKSATDWINVETKTIINMAKAFHVTPEIFMTPRVNLDKFQTRYLWDHLYPNMESFVQALMQHRPPAMARLVQVEGFQPSLIIVGKKIISEFHKYAKYIKPIRHKQLESLWPLYSSQP